MKLVDYIGGKYKKTLNVLSYLSIGLGYLLMAGIFYLIYTILKIYIFRPDIVTMIKVPPIMPLIPYIDKIVPGLPSFFFTYWIVILAIIAITHEFAHGIFMKRYGIKIKSTGFGFFPFFLPVFLAAFVEQDEESMNKKGIFEQMAVLSAGTFANLLTAILFLIILLGFFSIAFAPSGVVFDSYTYSSVEIASITMIGNMIVNNPSYEEILNLANEEGFVKIGTNDRNYLGSKDFLEQPGMKSFAEKGKIILYDDSPAINVKLVGAITEINEVKIDSFEKLRQELSRYSPGEKIKIKTSEDVFEVVLDENPVGKDLPFLGIGFADQERSGLIGRLVGLFAPKDPHIYYEPNFNGWSEFVYNLLWWIVLISISVALINMLPMGIFDGGRFFYLTILSITGKEKTAKNFFKVSTYFFLFLLLVLMVFWGISFVGQG
ncbi:MAG: M50 family metallopeptidase [archaeon]